MARAPAVEVVVPATATPKNEQSIKTTGYVVAALSPVEVANADAATVVPMSSTPLICSSSIKPGADGAVDVSAASFNAWSATVTACFGGASRGRVRIQTQANGALSGSSAALNLDDYENDVYHTFTLYGAAADGGRELAIALSAEGDDIMLKEGTAQFALLQL